MLSKMPPLNLVQRLFLDYETTTAHINFNYVFYKSKIEANLSYGRYLAKDDGYTLDLSRKTSNGFRSGIYFTRTNISAEEFGEGSFDKGFYFFILDEVDKRERERLVRVRARVREWLLLLNEAVLSFYVCL